MLKSELNDLNTTASTADPTKRKPHSLPKKIFFYVVLMLLPILLLLVFEFVLRLVGYGHSYPLFTSEGAPEGYLQPNPQVIQRYFPHPDAAPKVSPDTVFFKQDKAPDSYRIFIQGGSSAAGFPYGRWGSMQGMLDQRFKRIDSAPDIEIINTAMAAVNSYTLLDFVDEIIAHKPDLVMIYAGHNEFLGVMGAGSVYAGKGSRAATLLYLRLKDLRLYQLLSQIIWHISTANVQEEKQSQRSLMSQVAEGKQIAYGSDTYHQGVKQFRENIAQIIAKYRKAGIPVIIGTLASNEKDQVPFSTVGTVDWEAFDASTLNQDARDSLLNIDDENENAADWYKRGQLLIEQGSKAKNEDKARSAFQTARDLDALRFRAPTEFNKILRTQAKNAKGVYLADVERRFREDSPERILGKAHFLEHVHPNPRGYFLLGEAFVDVLQQQAQNLKFPLDKPFVDSQAAWQDIPITQVAALYGEYKIRKLTSDYPFTQTPKPVAPIELGSTAGKYANERAKGQDWLPVQEQALKAYLQEKNLAEAAKVAGNLSDALIGNADLAKLAGDLYRDQGDFSLAIFYHRRAGGYDANSPSRLLSLAQSYFLANRIEDSLTTLAQVLTLDPTNSNALRYKARLERLQGESRR